MAESLEVEIKLACGATHADALLRHPLLTHLAPSTAPAQAKLINIYFDTEGHDLRKRKIALRLRKSGLHWLQTLKASGARQDGVAMRREWEMPISGQALEFKKLRGTPLDDVLKEIGDTEQLKPQFRIEFTRRTWMLQPFPRFAPNFIAELAIDHGQILALGKTDRISEIELELKAGHVRELQYLSHILMRDLKIHEEPRSKAKRGYALLKAAAEKS
jgi:triphosphatase